MVQVRIASLALDPRSNQPVIILKPLDEEPGDGRLLPIWIGHPEATAILLALEGVEPPRPMTHDLMKSMLEALDSYVERVEITRVEEGTFYAALILRGEERTRVVDARPSDSIALAVRMGAPIFVAEEVLEAAAVADEPAPSRRGGRARGVPRLPRTRRPGGLPGLSPRREPRRRAAATRTAAPRSGRAATPATPGTRRRRRRPPPEEERERDRPPRHLGRHHGSQRAARRPPHSDADRRRRATESTIASMTNWLRMS